MKKNMTASEFKAKCLKVPELQGTMEIVGDTISLDEARQCFQRGELQRSIDLAREFLRASPSHGDALELVANASEKLGNFDEAITSWMNAVASDPSRVDRMIALAMAMMKSGKADKALETLALAESLHPNQPDVFMARGNILRALGRFQDAESNQRKALTLAPNNAAVLGNLCALFLAQNRPAEALQFAEQALKVAPQNAELSYNYGTALFHLKRFDKALVVLRRVVEQNPNFERAWLNLGETLVELERDDEAIAAFERAVSLSPNDADAHFNLAIRFMSRGEWKRGYLEYEWRRRIPSIPQRRLEKPVWTGEPMPGKTIVLTAEQGIGDLFQFIRYVAPARKQFCGRVIVEMPWPLKSIIADVEGIDAVVDRSAPLPEYDVWAPLLSLSHLCGCVPGPPYGYLRADSTLKETWGTKIDRSTLAVAIAWQGNPKYKNDARRSILLRYFERLARVEGVTLYSVQKHHGREQLESWPTDLTLHDFGTRLDENTLPFVDTAAFLSSVNLLVTSDTAIAHLAGAMGVTVWLALSKRPDWRWGDFGETTPWYPSMRLFRQRNDGDWNQVFDDIAVALAARQRSASVVPKTDFK